MTETMVKKTAPAGTDAVTRLIAGGGAVHADFQPAVDAARRAGPLHKIGSVWWCIGYDEVTALLAASQLEVAGTYAYFSDVTRGPLVDLQRLWLETSERTLHRRRRAQAHLPFTDAALMRSLLDAADRVIGDVLSGLDVPFEGDFNAAVSKPVARRLLVDWAGLPGELRGPFDAMIRALGATIGQPLSDDDPAVTHASALISDIFPKIVDARHTAASGGFLAALTRAATTEHGKLPPEEVAANVINFSFDTELLEPQITFAVAELLRRGLLAALPAQPRERNLLIWELARLGTASPLLLRRVTKTFRLAGHELQTGDWVVLYMAAALRDPTRFDGPDDIDTRRGPTALVFGTGQHTCLGARLAVQVIRKVLDRLARDYEVTLAGDIVWIDGPYRGIRVLPVTISPASDTTWRPL